MRSLALGLIGVAACAGAGAGVAGDAAPTVDAPATPAADAAPPLPTCGATSDLPAWTERSAPHRVVAHCDAVDLAVEALADGVIRLRYGAAAPERSYALLAPPAPAAAPRAGTTADGQLILCGDGVLAIIAPTDCRARVIDDSGAVLVDDADFTFTPAGPRVSQRARAGERFYGFGERTGGLDRRGRTLTDWNTDVYDPALGGYRADADPLYQSIPFELATYAGRAHGVFTDDSRRLHIDVAATDPQRVAVTTTAGGTLDQYVIAGPSLADVVRRYTALTGRAPLPPRWALGYQQSRWGYWPASRLTDLAAEFRARAIPADALWLDIQHMDRFRSFTWDPAGFPDPAALLQSLAAQGFKTIVIADPGLSADPGWSVYAAGVAGDHFLREPGGAIYTGTVWPGPAAFPDFTAPATRAWWGELAGGLADTGVRGIWLDVNEPTTFPESGGQTLPDDVPAAGDGVPTTMAEAHNVYALNEARATFEGLAARAPDRRPFVLSRAGYAGIQRYAAVWTGDVVSSWDGLRLTLPMLLGLGLSGVPFVGSDVGGYSGHASGELYARWMALGSISPFFRTHTTSGVNDQEPWAFGAEVEDASRGFIQARYRLLPYLYSLMAEAAASGAPPLRPLIWEFADDPALAARDDEAMLGPFLLVAPVLQPGATTRSVYLPAGRWYELQSGAAYDGPATVDVSVTLAALPTFARAGTILPRAPVMAFTDERPVDVLSLDLYPADTPSTFTLYEDAGDGHGASSRITYSLARTATGARFTAAPRDGSYAPPARTLSLRVRRVDHPPTAVMLDGAAVPDWTWDAADQSIVLSFADRDGFTLELTYDPAVTELRPPVEVTLEVVAPAGTAAVAVASSADGWATHTPLAPTGEPGVWRGTITVARGEWFFYKYTRGGWPTVEKGANCQEVDNRYRPGAAPERRHDTVAKWRDACPP